MMVAKFCLEWRRIVIRFHDTAWTVAAGAIAVLVSTSFAVAEQGGTYWTRSDQQPVVHKAIPARHHVAKGMAATEMRSGLAPVVDRSATKKKEHRLILQVNTNDSGAMNLALNNATNVVQYYKDADEKVKIEVVTFGPGLHMLREDTSPVKSRIRRWP